MPRPRPWQVVVVAALLLLALWRCGRGGGSDGSTPPTTAPQPPIAWVRGPHQHTGYLKHVTEVLFHMGYNVVNYTDEEGATKPWDVLWSHAYPFRALKPLLRSLLPHQKVNHFPGSGFISNKVTLAESDLSCVPKAFRMPAVAARLKQYAATRPERMFVQKSNDHRGIRVVPLSELDLSSEGSFVQEFIDDPLLVDGHKFDIGVYVVLTSVQPLRVYMYAGDVLLRFCPEPYRPFNASVADKYVVGDAYLPVWRVGPLTPHYTLGGLGMKDSLNAHLRGRGLEPDDIWRQVSAAIAEVFYAKEPQMIRSVKAYPSRRNFFELFRFDFIVDSSLKVWLMEANMSPNLSSKHFKQNALLYRRVVKSVLDVATLPLPLLASSKLRRVYPYEDVSGSSEGNVAGQIAEAAFRDVAVYGEHCGDACGGCEDASCALCRRCAAPPLVAELLAALSEHRRRGACVRLLPPPLPSQTAAADAEAPAGSAENALMAEWFRGKCLLDATFCS